MKEAFIFKNFSVDVRMRIQQANEIIKEYQAENLTLTLRQLYYQFVARGLIPNNQKEYKKLGSAINDGRMAGKIDWNAIEDRTRELTALQHWHSPADILEAVAHSFRYDKWATQPTRVEVWVEKEALVGVIERICVSWDIPFFACRGYVSQSEQYVAGKRFLRYAREDQDILVLHMGDHDPSGIDMTRDNEERIRLFMGDEESRFKLTRIALNEPQIRRYNPPPNPVKLTDSRAPDYRARFGDESWELDALDPKILRKLIETQVDCIIDQEAWEEELARETKARKKLADLGKKWRD